MWQTNWLSRWMRRPPGSYRQRGASSLQRLFRTHFTELVTRYEDEFAKRLGKFRLERITKAVERFLGCGDYRRGVARIQCTNPQGGSRACAARAPTAAPSTSGPSAAASSTPWAGHCTACVPPVHKSAPCFWAST